MSPSSSPPVSVGIIANPASGRDIRRLTSRASVFPNAEKASMIVRAIAGLEAAGVEHVLLMPDKGSISGLVYRALGLDGRSTEGQRVRFLDMTVSESIDDTLHATEAMCAAGVSTIIVLGGDGTHRAVAKRCGQVPLLALSTGTNNAFPEMREPTITGMAAALVAAGRVDAALALAPNKLVEVNITSARGRQCRDIAIVDAVVTHDRTVGARALWKPQSLAAAYLAYAEPGAIGLSSIGGLLQPVGRHERGGLAVQIAHNGAPALTTLHAPIAPGLVLPVPLAGWQRMAADEPLPVLLRAGTVALDGERELAFDEGDHVTATLREHAFFTVDVARCMATAAHEGLLRAAPIP